MEKLLKMCFSLSMIIIYPKSAGITVFQMAGNQIFNAFDMHARNNGITPLPKLIHHFGACFLALT
jgi:hypothetical protein